MLDKYHFISMANHMLYGALNAVRAEWKSKNDLDEPAYTASIVTKFPAMMNGNWGEARFGGCFIHKRPKVIMDGEKEGCEVGDLLVLCKKTINNTPRFNSALFQLKKSVDLYGNIKPDNSTQLRLYTEWPQFKYQYNYKGINRSSYNIQPKAVTPGAQYLFVNQAPCNELWYWDDYWFNGMPIVYTCSIPAGVMKNNIVFSFGSFLWNFIHWQNGRPISESKATACDDWSHFIWDLIEMTKETAFMHKGLNSHKIQRTSDGFFAFIKNKESENFLSSLYSDWLAIENEKGKDDNLNDGNRHIGKDDTNSEEEIWGMPILYIDLDGEKDDEERKEIKRD